MVSQVLFFLLQSSFLHKALQKVCFTILEKGFDLICDRELHM